MTEERGRFFILPRFLRCVHSEFRWGFGGGRGVFLASPAELGPFPPKIKSSRTPPPLRTMKNSSVLSDRCLFPLFFLSQ